MFARPSRARWSHRRIFVVGGGSWVGPVSLRKATSFGLLFGLTLITIAWVCSFLQLADRTRNALLGLFAVASVVETALCRCRPGEACRRTSTAAQRRLVLVAVAGYALCAGVVTIELSH